MFECRFYAAVRSVKFSKHVIYIPVINEEEWYDAYQQARKGPWMSIAADRERFERRIKQTEPILNVILLKRV